jgi:hypothetical protein
VIRAHVEAFQAWMIATRSASTALNKHKGLQQFFRWPLAVGPNAGLNTSDNITIDQAGNLLIREDPGENVQEARIVAYRGVERDRPGRWPVRTEHLPIRRPGAHDEEPAARNRPGTTEEYVENGQLLRVRHTRTALTNGRTDSRARRRALPGPGRYLPAHQCL